MTISISIMMMTIRKLAAPFLRQAVLGLLAVCACAAVSAIAAPGDLDTLDTGITGNQVFAVAVQPDGKIILGGLFTQVLGVPRAYIARLNADGTLDNSFDPEANGVVYTVAVQADGKVLLGGNFTTLQPNGAAAATTRNHVARLNADGTLDMGFDPNPNASAHCLAVQTDGKVLIGGGFSKLQPNGAAVATTRNHAARVNADGTLDNSFDPEANNDDVRSIVVQVDGKILLGGDFTSLQPNGVIPPITRNYIARFNADGTLDTGFDPNANALVASVAVQADGKVLLGGTFSTLQPNGAATATARGDIARVNADGTLDTGFDPKANSEVNSMTLQMDGKVVLGGNFNRLQPNGAASSTRRFRIARVNADGTLDTAYDPDANNTVRGLALQADGETLVSGDFTALQPNGAATATTRNYFARLLNDPASQTLAASDATSVLWSRSGAGPEVTVVTFEASTDGGGTWSALGPGVRVGTTANWSLGGLALPLSGQLRVRGRTTSGYQNASSGLIEQVTSYSFVPALTLTAPSGIGLNSATVNGTVNPEGSATTAYFEYGADTNYGQTASVTLLPTNGSTAQTVSASLGSLTPSTTYHYRLTAQNSSGTSHSGDATFTTISNDASLTNLTLSVGALTVDFSSGVTNYTADVPYAGSSVMITPTATNGNATVTVNGVTVPSGSASLPVNLNLGSNILTIVVTAQDGVTTRTYTVNLVRSAVTQKWLQSYGLDNAQFCQPIAAAVDSAGNVVVAGLAFAYDPSSGFTAFDCYVAKYGGTDGAVLWQNRFRGSGSGSEGYALALDSQGNALVTGSNGSAFFTAKYASSDGTMLWQKSYTGSGSDNSAGDAIAVDANDNVVVAGQSSEASGTGYYTAKYTTDGVLVWDKHCVVAAGTSNVLAMALDGSGNVVVTGVSPGSAGNNDYYTAKYAAADGALLWEKRYNGGGEDDAYSVAVDGSGNVIVTGSSYGGASDYDFYTAKYAAADGALLWERRYNGPGNEGDGAGKVVVDSHGDVIVTGTSVGLSHNQDIYTAKYSGADGSLLWEKCYNGPADNVDISGGLVVDPNGNVIIAGQSGSPVPGTPYTAFSGYTAAYAAADGALLWENRYDVAGGGFTPYTDGLALAPGGGVVVTGTSAPFEGPQLFTTLKYGPPSPSIMSAPVSNVSATTATLNGSVNPNGFSTTAQFQYGLTSSYGSTGGISLAPTDGSSPQPVSLALTGLTPGTTYHYQLSASNSVGPLSGTDLTFTTLTYAQNWREQYFGSPDNSGVGADTANPIGDGISNLMKFATHLNPWATSLQPGSEVQNGSTIQFTYTRSDAALASGILFTVEWSDTLATGSWSNTGVTEQILSDDGIVQQVTATLPAGATGHRFVHLKVTSP